MNARVPRLVARIALMALCWMTALYAFITSSTFAYLQFIKPRVFHWVGFFSDWHATIALVWWVALLWHEWPRLRTPRRTERYFAEALVLYAGALVLANARGAMVAHLADGPLAVIAGIIALTPLLWLAGIEHAAAWPYLLARDGATSEDEHQMQDGRLFAACVGTAVLLTAGYAALASMSVARAFEPDLMTAGLAVGAMSSLLGHLLVFAAAFAFLSLAMRVAGRSVARQYLLIQIAIVALLSAAFARFVGEPMGLKGIGGTAAAVAAGVTIALSWGGMRLTAQQRSGRAPASGLDVLFAPAPDHQGMALVVPLVAVLPLAWAFALVASRIDWDFALLKSGVVVVWVLTFALVYRAAVPRRVPTSLVALPFGVAVLAWALWQPTAAQQHVRDRYAVHNPSFRVADTLLHDRPQSRSFDRFLRANTGLTDVAVKPVAIDFAASLQPGTDRPNIFLFVIDSLRADYLSPYNGSVAFTPRIGAFASENIAFRNAFTRYGGTGLSMPAIWAGSVLAHKQYVLPFDDMNALEKLVDANGYRRIQTHDHITQALWSHTDSDLELDRGKTEMQFDFCATVDELAGDLSSTRGDRRPVFAQTRSLNLHVAEVRNGYVPPGKHYDGFEAPYAYRVERIDACFGAFIDRLRALGLYDRSIVIFTADHGELIGEDGRWGHSYHLFPQVIQVPLLMHLPRGIDTSGIDTGAVSLSTDITPTIYAALGYEVPLRDELAGRSLLDPATPLERREQAIVLSASYGAVYAVLSDNGRRLYIADAVQEQEYAYERNALEDLRWSPVDVDSARRAMEQLRIRRHIDTVARTYGLDQPF